VKLDKATILCTKNEDIRGIFSSALAERDSLERIKNCRVEKSMKTKFIVDLQRLSKIARDGERKRERERERERGRGRECPRSLAIYNVTLAKLS